MKNNFHRDILKGAHKKLIVEGDREVLVLRIEQYKTYAGIIAGLPNKALNKRILEEERNIYKYLHTYVIEPKQTQIPKCESFYCKLPAVKCRVQVKLHKTFKDKSLKYSGLSIVWFQDDFAFPIDNETLEKIKLIPFSKICTEYED